MRSTAHTHTEVWRLRSSRVVQILRRGTSALVYLFFDFFVLNSHLDINSRHLGVPDVYLRSERKEESRLLLGRVAEEQRVARVLQRGRAALHAHAVRDRRRVPPVRGPVRRGPPVLGPIIIINGNTKNGNHPSMTILII